MTARNLIHASSAAEDLAAIERTPSNSPVVDPWLQVSVQFRPDVLLRFVALLGAALCFVRFSQRHAWTESVPLLSLFATIVSIWLFSRVARSELSPLAGLISLCTLLSLPPLTLRSMEPITFTLEIFCIVSATYLLIQNTRGRIKHWLAICGISACWGIYSLMIGDPAHHTLYWGFAPFFSIMVGVACSWILDRVRSVHVEAAVLLTAIGFAFLIARIAGLDF